MSSIVASNILSQSTFPTPERILELLDFLESEGVIPKRWMGPDDGPKSTHSFPYARQGFLDKVQSYKHPMCHVTLYLQGDQTILFSPDSKAEHGSCFEMTIDLGEDQLPDSRNLKS